MKTRTLLMAIGLMALVSAAPAASPPASLIMIPPQINYQGRLVTTANVPYSNTFHTIDLSLYPAPAGGAKMWSERYVTETRDGYFSVNLGSGGQGLLVPVASNLPIWQVLWKTDGGSPDNFFMALTVRTETNGAPLASPVEATPRQQFLTAPFAYRAHQSVYATKADGEFIAADGVKTRSLSSTTNEIGVVAPLRLTDGGGGHIYANSIEAHGASPSLRVLAHNAPLALGVNYIGGISVNPTHASAIFMGSQPSLAGPGTSVFVDGKTVDIGTPTFTFNNRPMFVRGVGSFALSGAGGRDVTVPHNINLINYDVIVVGWHYPGALFIQSVYMNANQTAATVRFSQTPSSLTVTVDFLGIAKGLIQ